MNGTLRASLPVLLTNPRLLLLGAGRVAARKAQVLLDNRIAFHTIAAEASPEFLALTPSCDRDRKEISAADLAPFNIIVDATGSRQVAALIRAEKERRFLLVNTVDRPHACDFYFAALLNHGPLKIAVSTDGASPTLGQTVRDRIRALLPEDLGELAHQEALDRTEGRSDPAQTRKRLARVLLIGCGPGSAELLTLQAVKAIRQSEVVLYDHLIPGEILDLVPQGAERIDVGKQKGAHSRSQADINRLLLDAALRGKQVARLKNGDPFLFGRGTEEVDFLRGHGISVEVIAGLSSALAGPTLAGIPVTARGYATGVSIVSAHLAGSRVNLGWLPLLRQPDHTVVVLMGISCAAEIAQAGLAAGLSTDLPAAIVSNASRADQRCLPTTLGQLPEASRGVPRPALLIFGPAVRWQQSRPSRPQPVA
ncbi:MAG: uroporphyrinogen-III C-methyltransferase [Desulfuromonadales bacterium]|nr:uroporphyrinogen-III C-methyltransferase [Desulfuromonadales bacterium]